MRPGLAIQDYVWSNLVLVGGFGLLIVLGIVAVIVAIAAVQARERREPEKVLALRLAKGEITDAEYSRLFMLLRFGPALDAGELDEAARRSFDS